MYHIKTCEKNKIKNPREILYSFKVKLVASQLTVYDGQNRMQQGSADIYRTPLVVPWIPVTAV
jgi:hypothetical protein